MHPYLHPTNHSHFYSTHLPIHKVNYRHKWSVQGHSEVVILKDVFGLKGGKTIRAMKADG